VTDATAGQRAAPTTRCLLTPANDRNRQGVVKVLNRRVLLSFLLLGASAPIAAQVPLEYDVEPIDGGGPIYLPSIQLNDASSDIDRKSAVSNEVHSQQRGIGGAVGHLNRRSPNVHPEHWVCEA
jgi:hypothetical protein